MDGRTKRHCTGGGEGDFCVCEAPRNSLFLPPSFLFIIPGPGPAAAVVGRAGSEQDQRGRHQRRSERKQSRDIHRNVGHDKAREVVPSVVLCPVTKEYDGRWFLFI